MKNISLDLSGKIDPVIAEFLGEIDRVTRKIGFPFFMIGATARDIILEQGYGISAGRITKDVDLSVSVENWDAFDLLRTELLSTGHMFEGPNVPHRLRFRNVLDIDIIPFGNIENPKGSIAWPPDGSIRMSVLGFREALENSIIVRIRSALDVPFVSPPGMAILKLIAWSERRYKVRENDISDLALLLTHYAQAGNEERLFGEEQDLLKAAAFDMDLAGSRLLGQDMARMMRPETKAEILKLLDRHADPEKNDELIIGLSNRLPAKNYDRASALLRNLRRGIQE